MPLLILTQKPSPAPQGVRVTDRGSREIANPQGSKIFEGQVAGAGAFTILELLASMAVLMILAVLTLSILSSTALTWRAHKARLSPFEGARATFEALMSRLSQATLNTYWDYDSVENPTRYQRKSELNFVLGRSSVLIPSVPDSPLSAIFFVAPLGFTDEPAHEPLMKMLTACGFYVKFSDDPKRPAFLSGKVASRHRFRLFQFLQPGELLQIYDYSGSGSDYLWFQSGLAAWSFPMAENVLGLVIRAKYPSKSGQVITYEFDSRVGPSTAAHFNQLPPVVSVMMMVMDEDSAKRMEQKYGGGVPPLLPDAGAFTDPEKFEDDLKDWEDMLAREGVSARALQAEIPIRGARWSSD